MSRKAILWTIFGILAFAGAVYGAIMLLVNNLMVGIDQQSVKISDPIAQLSDSGSLSGSVNLVITNPTPFAFGISSIYAAITDPNGVVLATISEPFSATIKHNDTTTLPLQFTAQVETAAVSLITQLISKQVGATISGKLYLLGGLVPISFNESVNFKI